MHSLNITHNDLKTDNIVYSPSLDKLVFIDFGLSEVNIQKLGQMKL
jgi:tRNA A-37 threonylcarbamoyl transferase component Bud32